MIHIKNMTKRIIIHVNRLLGSCKTKHLLFCLMLYLPCLQCIQGDKRSLVSVKYLKRYQLTKCVEVSNGFPFISQYLNTCRFIHTNETFQSCAYTCMSHANCLAMLMIHPSDCETCISNSSSSRSTSDVSDTAEIYVRIDSLESHIDGKLHRFLYKNHLSKLLISYV